MPTVTELKKALVGAGFEVYRTRGDTIWLADRVRENLLMDAGVFVRVEAAGLVVGVVCRAQRSEFPGEDEASLFARARTLVGPAIERGYVEAGADVQRVLDPSDASRTLDVWCEVRAEIRAGDPAAAIEALRFAVSMQKAAAPAT